VSNVAWSLSRGLPTHVEFKSAGGRSLPAVTISKHRTCDSICEIGETT
jgi:hypothetical protein